MNVRHGVFTLILAAFAGCVEIGGMLAPDPGEPPAPNFNRNRNDNDSENINSNGNANENVNSNGNANDNIDTNGNENANDNLNTNGNGNDNDSTNENENENENISENDNIDGEDDAIFGGVGDIPPLEGRVVTTESGLKYIDRIVGGGDMPIPSSIVTVSYTGWLTDGTSFDSSDSAQFSLQGVIAGWTEGVGSMQVGGRRRLLIPPDLAYGEPGSPPSIPPNATLVFDIQLLEIQN